MINTLLGCQAWRGSLTHLVIVNRQSWEKEMYLSE